VTTTRFSACLCIGILIGIGVLELGCAGSAPPSSAAKPPTQLAGRCRGTLGLEAVPVSRAMRKKLALPKDFQGAVVREVLPGGPAAAAGIRPDDIVEQIGDSRIANECELAAAAYNRACEPVRVRVARAGAAIETTLVPVDQSAFYEKSCRDGITSACFRQAWTGWTRRGADNGRALELFASACKAGSAEACAYEGLQSIDSGERGSEAVTVLERSCNLGSGGGCANLAFLYGTGKFVKRDDRRAATLYVKSCDLGDPQGCYNAGLMAQDGRGVPADVSRAALRYEEACELGSSTGCTNLGFLYEHGRGVKADKRRAFDLYQRGCSGSSCQPSNLNGCVNVGRAYRDGLGVEKSEPRAAAIFREACDRKINPDDVDSEENSARACSLLGGLYLAGDGIKMDLTQGRELSELGCRRHDAFGCFNAAAVFAAGSGIEKDAAKAAFYLDAACKLGDGEGCHDLGVAYEKGNGVGRDPRRAAGLFKKSCQLGFAQACSKKGR
jgi:uncharacterized protein